MGLDLADRSFVREWPSKHRHAAAGADNQGWAMMRPIEGTTAAGLRCRGDGVDFSSWARVS
jgi:hypothetical protein